MSNRKDHAKRLKLLLTSIKDKSEDDPFKSNFTTDPRMILPDPETVSKSEYDYHENLCMDLDLLECFLPEDDDWGPF